MYKHLLRLMLSIGLGLFCVQGVANTLSDQFIAINSDGLGYTAQHTLATDRELVVMTLPAERINLKVQFSGPEKITFAKAHQLNPNELSLWSGSVFTTYRLTGSPLITQSESGNYTLKMLPNDQLASIENVDKLDTSLTWALPSEFELLTFSASESSPQAAPGRWSTSGNTVSFAQTGKPATSITIEYRRRATIIEQADHCLAQIGDSDECSPDLDQDGIPDYRDICIADEEPVDLPKNDASAAPSGRAGTVFGCLDPSLIVLEGVRFQSGQSYLDVQARRTLDRVAIALQLAQDQLFEVATHTDNAGRVAHNQRLSENRADAVRHYLMLRGVGPNQLQARGYGETSPAHDNQIASGRRANRRVELKRLE